MINEKLVPSVEHCERLEKFGKEDFSSCDNVWREYSLNNKNKWICCVNDSKLDIKLMIPAGQVTRVLPAPTVSELIIKFNSNIIISHNEHGFNVRYMFDNQVQGMFNIQEKLEDALADLWVQLRKNGSL